MAEKKIRDYRYLPREDYDRELKINGETVLMYSKDLLDELYPQGDYIVRGETWERKRRDKKRDIGRVKLAQKWLYVSKVGKHNKLFRKPTAFVETEGGEFIALLRLRMLPFVILLGILLAGVGIGWLATRPESAVTSVDMYKGVYVTATAVTGRYAYFV